MSPSFPFSLSKHFPFFARYWEALYLIFYALALCAIVLPALPYGFDAGHDSLLLMSTRRIWAGQVPFRDFYPWYRPIFHYFVAGCVALLGNNLYAVKFFTDLLSPVLCILLLVFSSHLFGLSTGSRIFVLIGTPILGLERLYYAGSLRHFLPIFFLSCWHYGAKKQSKFIYFTIFPLSVFYILLRQISDFIPYHCQ